MSSCFPYFFVLIFFRGGSCPSRSHATRTRGCGPCIPPPRVPGSVRTLEPSTLASWPLAAAFCCIFCMRGEAGIASKKKMGSAQKGTLSNERSSCPSSQTIVVKIFDLRTCAAARREATTYVVVSSGTLEALQGPLFFSWPRS